VSRPDDDADEDDDDDANLKMEATMHGIGMR